MRAGVQSNKEEKLGVGSLFIQDPLPLSFLQGMVPLFNYAQNLTT